MSEPAAPARASRLVIAIDGPSGSGKSSAARGVASRLGYAYLDTGAMYRAATWLVMHRGIEPSDEAQVTAIVQAADLRISLDPANPTVTIDGHDVTRAIREPAVSDRVSTVAANREVRRMLIAQQRQIVADNARIVVEGRDITTVVAPDADVRLLLVADPAARVARRGAELAGVDPAAVAEQVLGRDRVDSATTAFTQAAPGVQVLDSTHLSLDEVIDRIVTMAEGIR